MKKVIILLCFIMTAFVYSAITGRAYYERTSNAVYFIEVINKTNKTTTTTLKDVDPVSFKVFGNDPMYARDNNSVYYRGRKIKRADSKTFKHLENELFCDKTNIFSGGRIMDKIVIRDVIDYQYCSIIY